MSYDWDFSIEKLRSIEQKRAEGDSLSPMHGNEDSLLNLKWGWDWPQQTLFGPRSAPFNIYKIHLT